MTTVRPAAPPPQFFETPQAFRTWLGLHAHAQSPLSVGFHKRGSGRASLTWPEAVDEALCVGWIDGVRQRIDDSSYKIRFTPRKPVSHWSAVNIERVAVLTAQGRMQPAGLAAFARRTEARSRTAAYEQTGTVALDPQDEARFRQSPLAWVFFCAQAPSYRRTALWRVLNVKRVATRQSRLDKLIAACLRGERL